MAVYRLDVYLVKACAIGKEPESVLEALKVGRHIAPGWNQIGHAQGFCCALGGEGASGLVDDERQASPKVGAINQFRFGDRGSNDMKVEELVPGRRVKWRCVSGAKEWIGTQLTFDLKQEDQVTIVLFAQRGWKEQVEFMHYCSTKWGTYLLSLKALCETGRGTPYPDDVDIG